MIESKHFIFGVGLEPPYPPDTSAIRFAMGCFWGAEQLFWQVDSVYVTAAVYAGGTVPNPTYEQVKGGMTGHYEAVQVVYRGGEQTLEKLLAVFWENHDPTQIDGQANDIGSQYRSAILCDSANDMAQTIRSLERYQLALDGAGFGKIDTKIMTDSTYWLAEDHHQQYLAKNPGGYCAHGFCQAEYHSTS